MILTPSAATFASSPRGEEIVEPMGPVNPAISYQEDITYYADSFPYQIHRRVYDSGHYYQGYLKVTSFYKGYGYVKVHYEGVLLLADYQWNKK